MVTRGAAAVAAGVAAGVAVGLAAGYWLRRSHSLLRLRLRLLSATTRTVVLCNVNVPVSLLPSPLATGLSQDAEGLVLCNVSLSDGKVHSVTPARPSPRRLRQGAIDLHGAICAGCWVDSHTHLVKTHAHPRTRNPTGSISDALAVELDDQPRWAACACCRPIAFSGKGGAASMAADGDAAPSPCPRATDVARRMEFAIATAYHHGARAIRTHLDGTASPDAKLRATVYAAFASCRERWAKKGVVLQGVANLYLPLWRDWELAQRHVEEAMRYDGVLLGAYCGNVADTPPAETAGALDALFGYARLHDVQVDLHIDETNDPRCCCLLSLVHALGRARVRGYTREVLLGHCTALALQSAPTRREVIDGLRGLAPVTVVCNPSTNLGLQDRRGSAPPHCTPIDAEAARTPMWRGLTLVQELCRAGVAVGAASDNVRDYWHPYGDYDGLEVWRLATTLGQLDTAPCEGAWAHLVSDSPAAAMGASPSPSGAAFDAGAAADLIVFPDARRISELLSRPQCERVVLRRGRVQESRLPCYSELDDLVHTASTLTVDRATVLRGASAMDPR